MQVEAAVFSKQLKHVVEEADTGRDVVFAATLDLELTRDLCFLRVSLDGGGSHAGSTASNRLISSSTARAPSPCSSAVSSLGRALDGEAIPMNGTPAAFALRA